MSAESSNSEGELARKLMSTDVVVTSRAWAQKEPLVREGTIVRIAPRQSIDILWSGGIGHIVFCGTFEGIERMTDAQGNLLYENPSVADAYKRRRNSDAAREELRVSGKFYV